jgi:hypothetical protein
MADEPAAPGGEQGAPDGESAQPASEGGFNFLLGISLGAAMGFALDSYALGIALGVAMGFAFAGEDTPAEETPDAADPGAASK